MKNADMPASGIPETDWNEFYHGLTKREMFAMAAMQGLLADQNIQTINAVNLAVECADLLLRKLAGEDINPPIQHPKDAPYYPLAPSCQQQGGA